MNNNFIGTVHAGRAVGEPLRAAHVSRNVGGTAAGCACKQKRSGNRCGRGCAACKQGRGGTAAGGAAPCI